MIIIARQLILWVVFFMQKNLAAKEGTHWAKSTTKAIC
nr:MAG TPA: hypothetical protein [Caudoviricetes sp.]